MEKKIFTNMSLYAVFFLRHTRSYIGSFPNIHFMLKYIGKLCCMSVCVCVEWALTLACTDYTTAGHGGGFFQMSFPL